ncbi:MAG: acetolactate synthase [Polynucleobacter sp. 24-46-87]|uniref:thiamine pyrophosphate-binding protein n=1 Tax=Polynucleobacter sp. 35-46-11 TaxID=1970425 RepID=UPI000BD6661B|nr:thiamine pyrophosphate-binding protein [Polynucleobacter sp. 35-46-11]OYY14291.1 MAG: acetolactate synthase [Polynucleobacter sp. 35-46-11]OZA11009.1 MAG: acetolactate synthase [Polynucleobacter sp. 24-46-87]
MPSPITRGADALVASMLNAEVSNVFTLSGNHIMPIFDAIFDQKMRLIHTRHEAAAVHMADAWARLTGEVGIAMVTGGPGHANAVSALYTAAMAESPLVLLSGHAPINQLGMGAFQEMAQADIAAPLTKASWMCKSTADLPGDFAKAVSLARSGRPGPVHISLPSDVLDDVFPEGSRMPALSDFDAVPIKPDMTAMKNMLEKLKQAKRPLILTGPMMQSKQGRKTLALLESSLGIPVIGMESPRGIGDPSLGALSEVMAQSDCVLLLGKKLDFTLKFGKAPNFDRDCIFLQIDPENTEIERTKRAVANKLNLSTLADVPSAINALIELQSTPQTMNSDWMTEVHNAIHYRPAAWDQTISSDRKIHPVHAFKPLQSILDSHPDSVLVSDGGEIGQWAQACLHAPNRVINGVAGSIGAGLPFASAASLAKPGAPVVAIMGDGTFGFHSAEIDTAVRYQLPFLLIVGNDACWNAEHQIQIREYGKDRVIGCELLPSSYEKVASAFGGFGELVIHHDQVLPAAHRAIDSKLPACLNIMIDGVPAPTIRRN